MNFLKLLCIAGVPENLHAQAIACLAATSPLLTHEINGVWGSKLQEHFYLEG